jgi:Ca2+-binding RTX toxin-like protein
VRGVPLAVAVAFALALGAPAQAGTVSGQLASPDPRLDVVYVAAPGQRDEVRLVPHPTGVRVVDGRGIATGPFCFAVNDHDARCGPPADRGITVTAYTGDRADIAFTRIGTLMLESGDDFGIAYGARVFGGSGDDELRGFGDGTFLDGGPGDEEVLGIFGDQLMHGGPGRDLLVGGGGDDDLTGGPGRDQMAGGHGRDRIAAGPGDDLVRATDPDRDVVGCGAGRDRAFVSGNDRVAGCELVHYGWPG